MKKKACIFYSVGFGRNDGAPLYYTNVLSKMKDIEFTHLTPDESATKYGDFDYTFWVDWGEDGLPWKKWVPDGPKWGHKIYVASDTHITEEGKKYRFEMASKFDFVFFNQKRAAEEWNKWAEQFPSRSMSFWLPHAVEPQAYPRFEIIKKYDVCFIGHYQDTKNYNGFTRVDMLDRAFKEFPNFYFGTRNGDGETNMFEDASRKFSMSKIILNVSITDDINMRVFEAMASGSMLLTNYVPTLGEIFEDGKHLVMYKTLDELAEKGKYYLKHEEEREKIAKAGMEEVLKNHKYSNRIDNILEVVNRKNGSGNISK